MKIASIVGARPQFIKAAAVSRELRRLGIEDTLIHTGQHYDENMSEIFFDQLAIPRPVHDLGVGSRSQGSQTGLMLERVEGVLQASQPDWTLVFGDTNSTLAGALAAAKLHLRVAHVEAGLRSFNRRMPEEINRVLTDHCSDLLFAPTPTAVKNLRAEGISHHRIQLVGDVMYDAALYYSDLAEKRRHLLAELDLPVGEYVLATIHRAENTDDRVRLAAIVGGLSEVASRSRVVLPLHPRTRKALDDWGISHAESPGLEVIEPVGYLEMIVLEKHARLIVTDSGGVQKEAFFHQIPCVTLRDESEWVELIEQGYNRLVPPVDRESVAKALEEALNCERRPDWSARLYGEGQAGAQIVRHLQTWLEPDKVADPAAATDSFRSW